MLLLALSSITSVISTASAFQSNSISLQQTHDVSNSQELQRQSVMLMAHPYGGYPPPPPFADPYMMGMPTGPYNYGPPPPPHMRGGPQVMRGPPPNYYQRPQDIMSEADAILNNINEEEEWKTDQQKAKEKGKFIEGEVINFNPEQSAGGRNRRPLKNAAAYPSDLDMDDEEDESGSNEDGVEDSVFQGRMPGQPVNRNNNSNNNQQQQSQGPKVPTTSQNNNNIEEDPRAQHVILDEYDSYMNDFFDFPIGPGSQGPQQGMPPPSRGGPAVYTNEEEELIAAMGGRQRMPPPPPVVGGGPQPRQVNDINGMGNGQQRTTQEFAGLGTLTNNKGRQGGSVSGDPQQLNYNPEQNFNPQRQGAQGNGIMPPPPPQGMPIMPPPNQASLREEGFLGDSTLKEISLDYSGKSALVLFYVLNSCVRLGGLATSHDLDLPYLLPLQPLAYTNISYYLSLHLHEP